MTIDITDTIEQILNYGEEMPSDLDINSPFLSKKALPIKLLLDFDEKEDASWKEKKLNTNTGLRKVKKMENDISILKESSLSTCFSNNTTYKNYNQHNFSHDYKKEYAESKYFRKERSFKNKNEEQVNWNFEAQDQNDGFFDSKGNFIKETRSRKIIEKKETKPDILWFFKKNDILEGPYNDNEMLEYYRSGILKGSKIKRITDKVFLDYDIIKNVLNIFKKTINENELNSLFQKELNKKEEKILEKANEEDFSVRKKQFFENLDNESNMLQSIQSHLDGCERTKKMIKRLQLNLTVDSLYKKIKNKDKKGAIHTLQKSTSILKSDISDLIDIFLEEVGIQVVSDVDKDGFFIIQEKRSK